MTRPLRDLEGRALELMKAADFGPEAIQVNTEIVEQAPRQEVAWTRLGRCYMEQRQFDDAINALRSALALNSSNSIATGLLSEVRRRRVQTPTATERATTGFTAREFAVLETHAPDDAIRLLRSRIDLLFDAINASAVAERVARARAAEGSAKLFHANSVHGHSLGHISAFHYGGRWEPQFNIGWFSSPPHAANSVRIGIGFDTSSAGRDPDRAAAQARVLAYFERFQQTIARSWKRELARWMGANRGFIQYGSRPPSTDLLPDAAIERILSCRNAAELEWIFLGRWLFLEHIDDGKTLADRAKLARMADDVFRALLPIWLATHGG